MIKQGLLSKYGKPNENTPKDYLDGNPDYSLTDTGKITTTPNLDVKDESKPIKRRREDSSDEESKPVVKIEKVKKEEVKTEDSKPEKKKKKKKIKTEDDETKAPKKKKKIKKEIVEAAAGDEEDKP